MSSTVKMIIGNTIVAFVVALFCLSMAEYSEPIFVTMPQMLHSAGMSLTVANLAMAILALSVVGIVAHLTQKVIFNNPIFRIFHIRIPLSN